MLKSSFSSEKGTIITRLLPYYLDLGLVCEKVCRFVQYTPVKCFNNVAQSALKTKREGDEHPKSSVEAWKMELQANSSYGYQNMDRSRHTVAKYLRDDKLHAASNNKRFWSLGYTNDQVYEVEFLKSEIEHKEPKFFGFFSLQYAKLRMLELYYNLYEKYCDVTEFEELEMGTDSLYLVCSQHDLYDCIRPAMKTECNSVPSGDCTGAFSNQQCISIILAALSIGSKID